MPRKLLFIERDGGLLAKSSSWPILDVESIALIPDVVSALQKFKSAGYEFVVLTQQPGLGTPDYPQAAYDQVNRFLTDLFSSQGVDFDRVLCCSHSATEPCACRKPALGLVQKYLSDPSWDRAQSAVVGPDSLDLALAENMALTGKRVGQPENGGVSWPDIAHQMLDRPRTAQVRRQTRETDIDIEIDLDRTEDADVSTGIGFFDHMLEQLGKHGGFALRVKCRGDLDVDEHHTIEDVAIAIGQALALALGDKRGIRRYGFLLPMDEADAEVALDLSGRAYFVFEGEFPRAEVGGMPTELVPHFFRSLSDSLGAALHIRVRGENTHHMIEVIFKCVARALRDAVARAGDELPTTKGQL